MKDASDPPAASEAPPGAAGAPPAAGEAPPGAAVAARAAGEAPPGAGVAAPAAGATPGAAPPPAGVFPMVLKRTFFAWFPKKLWGTSLSMNQ